MRSEDHVKNDEQTIMIGQLDAPERVFIHTGLLKNLLRWFVLRLETGIKPRREFSNN